jgi:hypothetical protein
MQSEPGYTDQVRMDPADFNPKKDLKGKAKETEAFESWVDSMIDEGGIKPYVSMSRGESDGKMMYNVLDRNGKTIYASHDQKKATEFLRNNFDKLRAGEMEVSEYATEPKDPEIEKKDKENATKLDVTKADKMMNTTAYKRMKAGDERYADKTDSLEARLDAKLSENTDKQAMAKEIAKMYDDAYDFINDSSDNPSDIESDYKFGYNDDDSMEAIDLAVAFRKDLKTGMALQKQLQAQREKEGREGDWDPFNPESMQHDELRALMSKAKGESVSEDMGEKIANMAQNMTKDEFMSHADDLGLTPEEAAEHYEKMSGGAHAGKFEGNQFAQAVNKAKAAGMKAGDKFKVGDDEYTLKDAIEMAGLQPEEFFSEEEMEVPAEAQAEAEAINTELDRIKTLANIA